MAKKSFRIESDRDPLKYNGEFPPEFIITYAEAPDVILNLAKQLEKTFPSTKWEEWLNDTLIYLHK